MATKFANKRYDKHDKKTIAKYIDMAAQNIKGDKLHISIDNIGQNDAMIMSAIIQDFTTFTDISLWSAKCSQIQLHKYEQYLVKMEEKEPKLPFQIIQRISVWNNTRDQNKTQKP